MFQQQDVLYPFEAYPIIGESHATLEAQAGENIRMTEFFQYC
jgi:hypothetical protein